MIGIVVGAEGALAATGRPSDSESVVHAAATPAAPTAPAANNSERRLGTVSAVGAPRGAAGESAWAVGMAM